jgi:hypothetical protein
MLGAFRRVLLSRQQALHARGLAAALLTEDEPEIRRGVVMSGGSRTSIPRLFDLAASPSELALLEDSFRPLGTRRAPHRE